MIVALIPTVMLTPAQHPGLCFDFHSQEATVINQNACLPNTRTDFALPFHVSMLLNVVQSQLRVLTLTNTRPSTTEEEEEEEEEEDTLTYCFSKLERI